MDETANQMSDVRERLINALGDMRAHVLAQRSSIELADAILARFDVTEKPVVTADELGRMVIGAYQGPTFDMTMIPAYSARSAGQRMFDQLAQHGLAIVRADVWVPADGGHGIRVTTAAVGRRRAVSDQCPVCVDANARRPAEWQPPDDGRLYMLVTCSGCGNGYPLRYLAQLKDGRYLCRACFDVWMEDEQ